MPAAHPPEPNQSSTSTSPAPKNQGSAGNRFLRWIRTAVPTLTVIAVLAGLAAWGHASDWTLPKFSELITGKKANTGAYCAPGGGWCAEHNVPAVECIECNPKLLAKATD